jgi:large subunit ribosomal protein L16
MIFIPKKSKFKKQNKGKAFNRISKNKTLFNLYYGTIALKSVEHGRLNSKQIQTLVQLINKKIKKKGKIKLNIFPHTPISAKPTETRMGKGKGNIDSWICKIKPGNVICEIETNFIALTKKNLRLVQVRLPINTKIITE